MQALFDNKSNILSFTRQHHNLLLIGWYTLNLLGYLVIRHLKTFPMRVLIHRIIALVCTLTLSAVGVVSFVDGKFIFYIKLANEIKTFNFSTDSLKVGAFVVCSSAQILFGNLIDFGLFNSCKFTTIATSMHRVYILYLINF